MDAADVYLTYCAIKAHFSKNKYDYHKFAGKTKIKRDSFYKRKDRFFFARLARKLKTKKEIEDYFVANYIVVKGGWVGKYEDQYYTDWKKRTESLTYTFKNEIEPYTDRFEELFEWKDTHPLLLREYLGKRVSLETMCILDELVGYQKNWKEDLIWTDIKNLMNNYKKFLTIDKERCRMALLTCINNNTN